MHACCLHGCAYKTKSQVYPFWYYCNRSHADIPASGCSSPTTVTDECSDTHTQFGDR